jgi:hypothetical protein
MILDEAFQRPSSYGALATLDVDGLILPGGHAPGMKDHRVVTSRA